MSIRKWPDEEPFIAISSWLKFLAYSTLERSGKKCLEVLACFSSHLEHAPSFSPYIHITLSLASSKSALKQFLTKGTFPSKRTLLLLTLYHPYLIIFVLIALITTRYITFFIDLFCLLPTKMYILQGLFSIQLTVVSPASRIESNNTYCMNEWMTAGYIKDIISKTQIIHKK